MAMIISAPELTASRAAVSLEAMPPVPTLLLLVSFSHFQKILIQLVNLIDELRLRIRMGVIGEKAVDVG